MNISDVFFYGSGCMLEHNRNKATDFLNLVFNNSKIHVESDLVGAGNAIYGNGEGLVAILGTGSSLAFYKHGELNYRIPSLGLILGDEGSGAWFGKQLLNGIYTKTLSNSTIEKFNDKYKKSLEKVLEELNSDLQKGKYLSNYVEFIYENKEIDEIHKLAMDSFNLFFNNYILKYPESERKQIGFIGSIAFYFKEELQELSNQYNIEIKSIIRYPLDEIVKNYFQ